VCLACTLPFASPAFAQADRLVAPPAQRERVVPPPMTFASAEEQYTYLLKRAKGGTKHTLATLPDWSGIWQSSPR
jgi:hypothetical protein